MKRFFINCLAIALGMLPFLVEGQDCHIALQGRVLEEESGEPLAYASVFVNEASRGAMTDENGHFMIANLCESTTYTLEIKHLECEHKTQVVKVQENGSVEIWLHHNNQLMEVVIKEKAVRIAAAQPELEVDRIDMDSKRGLNLGETLKQLPGVSTLNTGASISKPVIQGLHSNRIAIVSNNVCLEGQQWGAEHAPEIDPFSSESIRVVKGAAGVRYGVGAMAGAVVMEPAPLRESPGFGGWLNLGGYSNGLSGVGAGALDWRLPNQKIAFRLQGTFKRGGNLRAPDYWLGNTGSGEQNALLMMEWKQGRWKNEISLSTFNQQIAILRASHTGNLADLQLAINSTRPLNNDDAFSYALDRPYESVHHQTLRMRSSYRINEIWRYSTQYAFQFDQRAEYDIIRTQSQNAQLSFKLWSNTLDLALEHLPIKHWQGGVGVQAEQQLNYVSRGGFIPDYLGLGGSVWALERYRRLPTPWEFEFGARYDYRFTHASTTGNVADIDTTLHFGNVSGTAGVIYHMGQNLKILLNSGYAWRPPHVNELFARGIHFAAGTFEQGNPALQPEAAWNSNLTFQWIHARLNGEISLYHNQIQHFLYLEPSSELVLTVRGAFPAYFYTQADAVLNGLDASINVKLVKQLEFEGKVSLLRASYMRKDSTRESHRAWLPLMPADRLQYGLRWNFLKGKSESSASPAQEGSFIRLNASTIFQQSRLPAFGLLKPPPPVYTLVGLDLGHSFKVHGHLLEAGINVQNLGNVRYRDYLDFFRFFADAPGINVGVHAKIIF